MRRSSCCSFWTCSATVWKDMECSLMWIYGPNGSVWALFCSPLSAVMSCSNYCVKPLLNTEHIPCVKSTHFVYNFLSQVNENIGGFLMNDFDVCKFIAACRSQSTRCAFQFGSDPATELGVKKRNAGCHKTNRS